MGIIDDREIVSECRANEVWNNISIWDFEKPSTNILLTRERDSLSISGIR
jgi:hypothetical protein